MLVQVGFLSETLVAAWLFAFERSFLCMGPEMVEEVVPLPEEHFTVALVVLEAVTLQYCHISLCPWIFVLIDSKLPGLWHILINFDSREVKVLSLLNLYYCSIWNGTPELLIVNLVL